MTVTASWTSHPTQMALVVVDVQNDFAHREGSLYVSGGEDVVSRVNEEVAAARGSGALVVYTQDWHPESTPHFAKDGGAWPVHCVQGSWGAAFHPDLEVEGSVIQKGTGGEDGYSGFTQQGPQGGRQQSTGLDDLLRQHHIHDLVVVGLAQDVCVKETVLDALHLGYHVSVPADATRPAELQPGDGQAALEAMAQAGADIGSISNGSTKEPSGRAFRFQTSVEDEYPSERSGILEPPQRPDLQDMPTRAQAPDLQPSPGPSDPPEHGERRTADDYTETGDEPPD